MPGRTLPLLLLLMLGALARAGQVEPVVFLMEERLHQPTAEGVALAMVPAEPVELAVEYGPDGALLHATLPRRVEAEELGVLRLRGLLPDTPYAYRVLVRRPGEEQFTARAIHGFRTLRGPDATTRFAVLADPHAWAVWSRAQCQPGTLGQGTQAWKVLRNALNAVRDAGDLDLVVLGTDNAMTWCGSGCVACSFDGQATGDGSAASAAEALTRYRAVFGTPIYGRFGADLPMLYMLGDHDGERGWSGVDPACDWSPDELAWSTSARAAHVPDARAAYGGGEFGNYYAVRTGDVLLVALDVGRYTTELPTGPASWTLGQRQLTWLSRVLASSDATFKIVMAEHLLGGQSGPVTCHWKGRGSLTATDDGTPAGTFLGEQALVHELMKQHGAQLFLSFHDHVVAFGEKLDPQGVGEGVHYLTGGQCAGTGMPGWAEQDWYREAMDFDGDGVPEYLTGVTGTTAKGWWRVTVEAGARLTLEYVVTAPGEPVDGEVALTYTLTP